MSYFSALARHSSLSPSARLPRAAAAIDPAPDIAVEQVERTDVAAQRAVTVDPVTPAAMVRAEGSQEAMVSSPADATALRANRLPDAIVGETAEPATSSRQVSERQDVAPPPRIPIAEARERDQSVQVEAAPHLEHETSVAERPLPVPPRAAESLPTIEEIRRWVAQSFADRAPDPPLERSITREPMAPLPRVSTQSNDAAGRLENFTLEIGSIEITVEPPAPGPRAGPTSQPAPPATTPTAPVNEASRHYIRC